MAYSSITKPSDYFDTTLITGNGSTQNITGLGFQPDWIWMKRRNATGHNRLIDSVRGSNKIIQSDLTNAEGTDATYVTSFNSDGWSIGTNTDINATGGTAVGWSWLAGGSASSNTDGTITSSVSANTTAGFSIVSFTGNETTLQTVGHGLGVTPKWIIVKNRSTSGAWMVYHESLGVSSGTIQRFIQLNNTNAQNNGGSGDFPTAPTSSVFGIGNFQTMNKSGDSIIAYCFAEKKGYSKFGSYTGNGNADGTFVYTGFKPAMIIVKRTDTTGAWVIYDNKRDTFNPADAQLVPSSSEAEATSERFDFLSNGFKLITTATRVNASGSPYIYMAFAESPFVTGASGIPTTAR